jgi:alpha-L-rhamnosidase
MILTTRFYISFLIFHLFLVTGYDLFAGTNVKELRCEYLVNPIGIDVVQPRLSWKIISGRSDVLQTAYEIRVAASGQALESNDGLLWGSGKNILRGFTRLQRGQQLYGNVGMVSGPMAPFSIRR